MFVNPSTTDVVCTTTAEALAMGKIVVCPDHPSNEFFKQFPNCRTYIDDQGFIETIKNALSEEPAQLTEAQMHDLSWKAATSRFLKVTGLEQESDKTTYKSLSRKPSFASTSFKMRKNLEDASAFVHFVASGFEVSRKVFGAVPGSLEPDEQQRKELGLPNSADSPSSKC